jgi:hypothetical protein
VIPRQWRDRKVIRPPRFCKRGKGFRLFLAARHGSAIGTKREKPLQTVGWGRNTTAVVTPVFVRQPGTNP